jgi:hypothetical protein
VEETPTTSGSEVTGRRDSVSGWARRYNHQCPLLALALALATLAPQSRSGLEFQGCKEEEAKAFGLHIIPLVHYLNSSKSLHVIVVVTIDSNAPSMPVTSRVLGGPTFARC